MLRVSRSTLRRLTPYLLIVLLASKAGRVAGEEVSDVEACAFLSSLAEIVMEARQVGLPLGGLLESTERLVSQSYPDFPEKGMDLIRELAVVAYKKPRGTGEWTQQRAVEEFRDQVMMDCLAVSEGNTTE